MKEDKSIPNLYETKRQLLSACTNAENPPENTLGKLVQPRHITLFVGAEACFDEFHAPRYNVSPVFHGLDRRQAD